MSTRSRLRRRPPGSPGPLSPFRSTRRPPRNPRSHDPRVLGRRGRSSRGGASARTSSDGGTGSGDLPDQLGRRAAALLHEPTARVPLERRVPRQVPHAEAEVLPRAAAVATARNAVREGRARQALRAAARAADSSAVAASRAGPPGANPPSPSPVREVGAEPEHTARAGGEGSSTERRRPGPGFALALRERLPLWLQLRCGVEPRALLAIAVVLLDRTSGGRAGAPGPSRAGCHGWTERGSGSPRGEGLDRSRAVR
jgi:hypothetical protein